MIAAIAVSPNTATITAPSGWTLIRRTDSSTYDTNSQTIYRLVAGGSEPASYTWTLGGSPTGAAGGILTFYGIDTTTPVNVENGQETALALTLDTPSVTTTVNNTILVTVHSFSSSATWTPPSGMTEAVDISSDAVPLATGISLEMSYVTQSSAGSTGTKTATASNDADSGVAQILALQGSNPAPVATAANNIQTTSFSANWNASSGATRYRLDVATDSGFTSFVTGYNNLDVGNVLTYSVNSNISSLTTYHYRVRAYNGSETSGNSNTISLTTACTGLGTFQYRKSITVQSGQVSSGPQLNFPMLINISSDNDLKSQANGGHVVSNFGYDIIFRATDDATCGGAGASSCTLSHEIENYSPTTGELVAWVRVPSINNGTIIYMYYGNSCISSSTENTTDVWDSNYDGVWHLKESGNGTAGEYKDSTSHRNNGQGTGAAPTRTTGSIGYGQSFDGSTTAIVVADSPTMDPDLNATVSAWMKLNATGQADLVEKGGARGYTLWLNNNVMWFGPQYGNLSEWTQGATPLRTGVWYAIDGVNNNGMQSIYINGVLDASSPATVSYSNTGALQIGNGIDGYLNGVLDEIRVENTARSADWIRTKFNNQNSPSAFYSVGVELAGQTAINLLSFTATGRGEAMEVAWQTGQEAQNKGFDLYRGASPSGPWVKLNAGLIPSGSVSGEGVSYTFIDTAVSRGRFYYYKLEDVDVSGAVTLHGPICVDWDGDGMPDDWEIAHGLNPAVNDAVLDSDGDGVSNLLEYQRGTDPFNPDTDGDGIPDGAEKKNPVYSGGVSSLSADVSVQVLASDSRGMTLELLTKNFDVTPVTVNGQAFERLRVPAYVHGYTLEPGLPQVPLKGILLDIPQGKQARVEVLDSASRVLGGYRVYPAPLYQADANNQVAEVFSWDVAAYQSNAYYPAVAVELSSEYVFRGQAKQRLIFYPLRFKPGTGELLHCERIRVRVKFVEALAPAEGSGGQLRAASAVVRAPSAATGWSIPAGAAYKVSTNGEGIYRITRAGLQAAGIADADIDAVNLSHAQLFNLGAEQAIHVYDQNANNRLDAGDYISFYAAAVPAEYAKYARYNVYWLVNAGSPSPLRMQTVDGTPSGGSLAASHDFTLHHELNQTYLQSAKGPDGMDRWIFSSVVMGSGFIGGGIPKSFTLSLPGALSTGNLSIRMYSPYDRDHEVAVVLNGSSIGIATWSGIGYTEAQFARVSLMDGDNTVSISCKGSTDKTGFDWFEVVYERTFAAVSDTLKITHTGGYRYQIGDFTTNDVEVYDITDASAVRRVLNGTYTGSGPYTLEVEPAWASGTKTYLSVATGALKTPAAVVKDTSSGLAAASNGADWILITHRDIGWDSGGAQQNWVTSLVNVRRNQGLRTAVVDVQDIFDEFGYGLVNPQAIKDFITYAYESWQSPAPQYVLLVGDTSYDYKDNWNLGTVNYVPGHLIYTTYLGETISDEWYVQVSGADAVSDLSIGRLPANSVAQAEDMVTKIVAYENTANAKLWEKRVILVADNQAEDWESVFETMNEDAAALLPEGMPTPERFYLQEYENEHLAVADLKTELKAAINAGALIINYSGHGSVNILATEKILDNRGGGYGADVTGLSNSGMYPFVVNMSCLTGYFIYPTSGGFAGSSWLSLAEGFMLPSTKGAIAALMPTAMTGTTGQHVLSNALYEGIFSLDKRVLGDAVIYAKQQLLANGDYREESNTFMLFGDPATKLKVPLPRRPTELSAVQDGGAVALSWAAALDCDGNAVAGYNLYRRSALEQSYILLNTRLITGLSYTDAGLTAAPAGSIYYYALSAVDTASDESVKSAPAALTIADSGDGGGDGGGGGGGRGWCFISAAGLDLSPDLLKPFGAMALLICLVWISLHFKEGREHLPFWPLLAD